MAKKIVLTGATGTIGKKLYKALIKKGYEVTIFTRSLVKGVQTIPGADEFIEWDYRKKNHWQEHIDGKDAVIHLAGANLFSRRWNEEYKKEIFDSRQISTRNIVDAISKAKKKPEVFICASGINYYDDYVDDVITEEDKPGNDFLAKVCIMWENEAAEVEKLGVRRVSIRTGVVLAKDEGALKEMIMPYKFFIGGPLSTGRQWFPWIHIDDLVGIYLFALENKNLSGAVNAAAPDPVTMNTFSHTLGNVLRRPSFFHVPKFALRIILGEFGEIILKSHKVIPKKVLEEGFKFEYEDLEEALRKLLR